MLLRNLGAEVTSTLFAGDAVGAPAQRSEGFPTAVMVMTEPAEATLTAVLDAGRSQGEWHLPNHLLGSSFDWRNAECADGELRLEEDAGEVVAAFQVNTGRPRSAAPVEGGWPDPSQQTLLGFEGEGEATVYVNGKAFDALDLGAESQGTVADIDLEMGWNTVIVRWRPQGRRLRLLWRNRQGEPEVGVRVPRQDRGRVSGRRPGGPTPSLDSQTGTGRPCRGRPSRASRCR